MTIINEIENSLRKENIFFEKNVDLKKFSYSKTGCKVDLIIYPSTVKQIIFFLELSRVKDIDWKVIGNTTNLLFSDSVSYSTFICLNKLNSIHKLDEDQYEFGAGVNLSVMSRYFLQKGISGFEGLEGIPGNIGGALTMNAGAYGYSISDYLHSCLVIDNGEVKTLLKEQLKFKTRSSIFLNSDKIIVSATFKAINFIEADQIEKKMRLFHAARHTYQEFNYPNLGSIFCLKNKLHDLIIEDKGQLCKLKYLVVNYLFYNKVARIFNRKDPLDYSLTKLIINELKLEIDESLISKRNINTFINKNYDTVRILSHFKTLHDLVYNKSKIKLENEYVMSPISRINNLNVFNREKKIYLELKND
jgi:UDP-N-acetylmuramate dehydrogenase